MMLLLLITLLSSHLFFFRSASAVVQATTTDPHERIIGGKSAPPNRHPYVVSLQFHKNHICGGSLILNDVVLTAAHCLTNIHDDNNNAAVYSSSASSLEVVIGRHADLHNEEYGEVIPVVRHIVHERYKKSTFEYDFALLFLERSVQLHHWQQQNATATILEEGGSHLITLNQNNSYPPPKTTTAQILGWGMTLNTSTSDQLQIVDTDIISNIECESVQRDGNSYNGSIYDSMICTFRKGRDSCQGDSGGPVIVPQRVEKIDYDDDNSTATADDNVTTVSNDDDKEKEKMGDVLIGVVSWGLGCAYLPGVNSRVSMAYNWIQEYACAFSNDTPGSTLCDSAMPSYQPTHHSLEISSGNASSSSSLSILPRIEEPTSLPTSVLLPTSTTLQPTIVNTQTMEPTLSMIAHPTALPPILPSHIPTRIIESPSSSQSSSTQSPTSVFHLSSLGPTSVVTNVATMSQTNAGTNSLSMIGSSEYSSVSTTIPIREEIVAGEEVDV